jgi:hypothetical protein
MTAQPTFETTYPKAPFAELIRLTLSLTATLVKLRTRLTDPARVGPRQHA